MVRRREVILTGCGVLILQATLLMGAERQVTVPRVPADKLTEARALTNPTPASPESVQQGEALYRGKGTCVNCHGPTGVGNGPVAAALDPSPRNFRNDEFWQARTEGELFLVIKQGSIGTSMIGFGDQLTDAEIWAVVRYLQNFRTPVR